jgi:hypothetical protein
MLQIQFGLNTDEPGEARAYKARFAVSAFFEVSNPKVSVQMPGGRAGYWHWVRLPADGRTGAPNVTELGRWRGALAPCAYRLCHPNVVPMETAEPSD